MKQLLRLIALLVVLTALVGPALAYEDYVYNFGVKGPKGWVVLPNANVPGQFRFGWTSPEWAQPNARDTWGASVNIFVKDTEGISARELLEKNVAVIEGKTEVKPDPRTQLRVVKQQTFTLNGKEGFIMEVVGNGTGFGIGIPVQVDAKGKPLFKIVPTRQRWYCVVKGKNLIGILSTCPDSLYGKYAPTFNTVEKTLEVR